MVSVIVPAYNEELFIGHCLQALARQITSQEYEVIVIDNASTDKTAIVAKTFSDRLNLKVISETRKGRGQARATGFDHAKGDIVFCTDADTQVPPDWIERMVVPFKNAKVVAVVSSGAITGLNPISSFIFNAADVIYMFGYRLFFGYNTIVGFGFAVRKKSYIECGGFNRRLKAQEDVEFAVRLRKFGPIVYLPNVWVKVSGRRFQRGMASAFMQYFRTTFEFFILKKKSIDLDDVR